MNSKYQNPKLTVDIIIETGSGIVLIERKNEPFGWALPGGFVDLGESLETAAKREAKEETSMEVELLRQFHTYSNPERDKRFHTVSTVFIGKGSGNLIPRDDAKDAKIFEIDKLPKELAFDHNEILSDYKRYINHESMETIFNIERLNDLV
ncbi:MAG: NUDIX hydrolase [Desulfobacterales bacterium]|nr:NUDIX hydrolase [Desulfobacterales bacterium]